MKFAGSRQTWACFTWTISFALFVLVLVPRGALAQSKSSEVDPRVQQLYTEAKAAEARGELDAAIAKYQSILQVAPSLGAAYNNLGSLYLRQRQYGKAVEILEQGLKIDSKMSSATALLGVSLYEMGDYARARRRLEAALRANPKDTNVEMMLANDLVNLKEPEAAVAHLREIVRREPNNQEAWYRLGKIYMQLSQEALVKFRDIDPNSYLVHELSGEIMEGMNNYDGAILEYKKAVEMAPQEPGTHYKLGSAYYSILDWNDATKEFQAELANDPRNCRAEWRLGSIILEQHGDPQAALDDINKAVGICGELPEARLDRAKALLRMERTQEAVPDLEAAERTTPDDPTVHFLLAQAYRNLGRSNQAQVEMQTFSKLEESARAAKAAHAQQIFQDKDKQQNTPQ